MRCVLHEAGVGVYEERITLWQAGNFTEAIERAEAEARDHTSVVGMSYVGLAQAYKLADDPTREGAEVFSLMRDSQISPDEYLARFFATGAERVASIQPGPVPRRRVRRVARLYPRDR